MPNKETTEAIENLCYDIPDEDVTVSTKYGLDVEISLYHWLIDHVEIHPLMNQLYNGFIDWQYDQEQKYDTWKSAEDFVKYLQRYDKELIRGLYGERSEFKLDHPFHYDYLLSEQMSYLYFEYDGDPIILIGHYAFTMTSKYMTGDYFFSFTDVTLGCPGCRTYYDSDGGYYFPNNNNWRDKLNDYKFIEPDDDYTYGFWLHYLNAQWKYDHKIDLTFFKRKAGITDPITYTPEDGKIVCPQCGEHILQAWF